MTQPVTWGMVFNSTWAGTGFTQVPGGPEWAEYSVLSYHYYCPLYSGQATPFDMYVCDELMGPQVFNAIDQVLSRGWSRGSIVVLPHGGLVLCVGMTIRILPLSGAPQC
jgi:hypothetical protein